MPREGDLRARADDGDVWAQEKLGAWLISRDRSESSKPADGEHWLTRAAQAGSVTAQLSLGLFYLSRQDDRLAAEWISKAANGGEPDGMNWWGKMLQEGRGVEVDASRAVDYFERAAEMGHVVATVNLGAALLVGRGREKDENDAVRWLQLAKSRGDRDAERLLAVFDRRKERRCSSCGVSRQTRKFSATQWTATAWKRKCNDCLLARRKTPQESLRRVAVETNQRCPTPYSTSAFPAAFFCPLTLDLMKDPVMLCTEAGASYERDALETWLEENPTRDPLTNKTHAFPLKRVPNRALRDAIEAWTLR